MRTQNRLQTICSSVCTSSMLRELSLITLLVLLRQHGVKAVDLITCEGQTANLTCAQGTIKVLAASYGRSNNTTCSAGRPAGQLSNVQCTQNTTLNVTATRCDGKQNCSVVVSNANFTDPCPGTYKYLSVSFDCILPPPPPPPPSPNVTSQEVLTCESDTARLSCAQGTIKVLAASYGRSNNTTCSAGRPAWQLSNVQCFKNTSLTVATQCDGKQNCSVVASNANFTDPCPGTYKYLSVSFDCILPPPPPPPPSPNVTSQEVLTCESDTARLSCAQGTIKVLAASYGRSNNTTCSAGRPAWQLSNVQCFKNTSLTVATQCDGKQNCSVVASNANFTDPCPGTYKYLSVSFDCILPPPPPPPPSPSLPVKQFLTCESDTARLSCGMGTIKVLAANYGRTNNTTCSTGRPASQLSNVQCIQNTTLNVLASNCDGKEDCSVAVGNAAFGNPCSGTYKYLNVSYTCVPQTSITCQNESSNIKCEGKRRLYILFANYGRRDRSTCPCSNVSAMSSTCTSIQTTTLQFWCNGKKHCHVRASNSNFVDRCPHTHKYLEVVYSCG